MDHVRFDSLTRWLGTESPRRGLLRGLVGAGLGVTSVSDDAAAGKKGKNKKRKKRAKPNAFGCLSVGDPCKNAGQCCAGICVGKKGKKQCRAHGTGTCNQAAEGLCEVGIPTQTACNNNITTCRCVQTTAGSKFCADLANFGLQFCADCQKDADCQALGFPSGSACVPFSSGFCAGNCESGMGCAAPCGTEPPAE